MANVRFFQVNQLPASADKHTFYLVGSESAGFDLYIGDKKLNEAVEIQNAVDTLTTSINSKADLEAFNDLKDTVDAITSGEGGDSLATLRAALNNEVSRAQAAEAALDKDIEAAEGRLTAVEGRLDGHDGSINGLTTDVTALKTTVGGETSGLVKNVADLQAKDESLEGAIDAEKTRAEGIEGGLRTDVDAIKADYLKAADKEGLLTEIGKKVDQTAYDTKMGEIQDALDLKAADADLDAEVAAREAAITGLQTQINTIMSNPDAEGAINSINEFTQYIEEHGEIAEGFRTDINKNKDDIAAEVQRATGAEGGLSNRIKALEDISHDFAAADTALKNELTTEIGKKVDQTAYDTKMEALEAADSGFSTKIEALEAEDDRLETAIGTAKTEAINTAAGDATTKANAAETAAKAHTDTEIGKVNQTITNLTGVVDTKASQSDFNTLSGTVTDQGTEITNIKNSISGLQTSLGSYYTKTEIDNKLTTVNNNITTNSNAITGLDTRMGVVEAALTWQVQTV